MKIVVSIIALVLIIMVSFVGCGAKKNPHENCQFQYQDREYFGGPMRDVYYSPEFGMHFH